MITAATINPTGRSQSPQSNLANRSSQVTKVPLPVPPPLCYPSLAGTSGCLLLHCCHHETGSQLCQRFVGAAVRSGGLSWCEGLKVMPIVDRFFSRFERR